MADQPGIGRSYVQPRIPDFSTMPPILFGLSDREMLESRIGQLEQKIDAMMDYIVQQQQTLDTANDLLARRLNEFLVERQETLTTITQWTANQNNVDLGDGIFFRVSTDGSKDLTGILAGIDGKIIRLVNVGAQNIVIKNQSASSDAANRFLCDTAADITVSAEEGVLCLYDATTARWRVFSQTWT